MKSIKFRSTEKSPFEFYRPFEEDGRIVLRAEPVHVDSVLHALDTLDTVSKDAFFFAEEIQFYDEPGKRRISNKLLADYLGGLSGAVHDISAFIRKGGFCDGTAKAYNRLSSFMRDYNVMDSTADDLLDRALCEIGEAIEEMDGADPDTPASLPGNVAKAREARRKLAYCMDVVKEEVDASTDRSLLDLAMRSMKEAVDDLDKATAQGQVKDYSVVSLNFDELFEHLVTIKGTAAALTALVSTSGEGVVRYDVELFEMLANNLHTVAWWLDTEMKQD